MLSLLVPTTLYCSSVMSILTNLHFFFFFFNDTATTEIYTLSLHDALPICDCAAPALSRHCAGPVSVGDLGDRGGHPGAAIWLVCHYPDHAEADERVRAAAELQRALGLPIWLFGSASARYPESVEARLRTKLLADG